MWHSLRIPLAEMETIAVYLLWVTFCTADHYGARYQFTIHLPPASAPRAPRKKIARRGSRLEAHYAPH